MTKAKGLQRKGNAPNRKAKAVREPKKGEYSPIHRPVPGGGFERPGARKV